MSATSKKRLCWNCEGNVPAEMENCLYCGVYLGAVSVAENKKTKLEISPPYKQQPKEQPQAIPKSPYGSAFEQTMEPPAAVEDEERQIEAAKASLEEIVSIVKPLVLLLGGSLFLLFSLMMVFFSEEGVFTLQWKSKYWFYYLLASLPLLYLGWRALAFLDRAEKGESLVQETT